MTRPYRWIACSLLLALAAVTGAQDTRTEPPPPPLPPPQATSPATLEPCRAGPARTREEIEARLQQAPVAVAFHDTPFRQVISTLRALSEVDIVLDTEDLLAAGIDLDAPLSLQLHGSTMKSTLTSVLKKIHLAWEIRDGVVHVTTAEVGNRQLRAADNEFVLQVRLKEAHPDGTRETASWPRITLAQGAVATVFDGTTLALREGTVRDVLAAGSATHAACCRMEETQPTPLEVDAQVGHVLHARLTRLEEGWLRLDLALSQMEVEAANKSGVVLSGANYRVVQRLKPGQTVQVPLRQDGGGAPSLWLEVAVNPPQASGWIRAPEPPTHKTPGEGWFRPPGSCVPCQ